MRASAPNSSCSSRRGKKSAPWLSRTWRAHGDQKLNGTEPLHINSRGATLNAVLTARVVSVLPGGSSLSAIKSIQVNSEQRDYHPRHRENYRQTFSTANPIVSTQVADIEIRVNGKAWWRTLSDDRTFCIVAVVFLLSENHST